MVQKPTLDKEEFLKNEASSCFFHFFQGRREVNGFQGLIAGKEAFFLMIQSGRHSGDGALQEAGLGAQQNAHFLGKTAA